MATIMIAVTAVTMTEVASITKMIIVKPGTEPPPGRQLINPI